jgi:hypothetical protein
MKKLLIAVTAAAFAVGSLVAFADDKSPRSRWMRPR